ncbi:AfaD family invasin [Rahnella sp. ChDrAdgB13]|uniref:AfaD family invasin n=1 Tax=Rahnella sp. ChDrAdgB13 TaxID=1850581 RepID=UPI001AD89779|nr:AfaD family invasin [Rahnella sp. ChDrAdgB13]
MMNRKTMYLIAATLLAGMVSTAQTRAANSPQLVLQMNQGLQAGAVRDGTKLGRGTLVSYDTHTGFQLWSEPAVSTPQPDRYVLTGNQNPSHTLRVRLVPQQLAVTQLPDTQGITVHTSEDRMVFDILADGVQTVAADRYTVNINGALLLP